MKKTEKINFFLVFIIIGIAFGDLYGNLITPLARYNAETAFFCHTSCRRNIDHGYILNAYKGEA